MIVNVLSFSEIGLTRCENQDAIFLAKNKNSGIFVVADGMGGHYNGGYASTKTVEIIRDWWKKVNVNLMTIPFLELISSLEDTIQYINSYIYNEYKKEKNIGGTTLNILLVHENFYALYNVGDSRTYCCNQKESIQISVDDVWQNQTNIRNNISLKDVKKDSRYGKLTKAIGVRDNITFSVTTCGINGRVVFLLCSDGFYKYCDNKKIEKMLKKIRNKGKASYYLETMKLQVYKKGATDNLSVILVELENKEIN